MSGFPEKIKQVFVEGWFKILHSKNLQKDFLKIQNDVLDCYAEEEVKWEALISKAEKDCAKCNSGIEERKQKLQKLIQQWDNQSHLGIVLQETEWLLGEFGQLRKELLK